MRSPFRVPLLSVTLLIAICSLGAAQGYENGPPLPGETFYLRPVSAESPQPPADLVKPRAPAKPSPGKPQPSPGTKEQTEEPAPTLDLADLGAMAGGAAGTGTALPTLQGDTTWGGRPAFPHVIAPALVADPQATNYYGLPIYNDSLNHLVFSGGLGSFVVDNTGVPASLKNADLVLGIIGFPLAPNTFLPFSAMLLSSPLIGYDMINWAENGSVLPQDRVFFDYRHFDSVGSVEVIGLNGPDPLHGHPNAYYSQQEFQSLPVDRFVLGLEKTFFDGRWSVEVRVPMQGEAASVQTFFPGSPLENQLELGNIGIALKGTVYRGDKWAVTEGLGLQLPTAPATDFTYKTRQLLTWNHLTSDLHETLEVKQTNDTVWLNPFLGISYDSQRRFFAQGLVQLCVPLNKSSASLNTAVTDGNISLNGNVLFDFTAHPLNQSTAIAMAFAPLLRADVDLGYWLYQNPNGRLNALAAVLEINDTNALGGAYRSNVVDLGPQLVAEVGKTEIDTGLLVPVSADRAYKWEYVLRVNRRF